MAYATHQPATYALNEMTEQQFAALREALILLRRRPLPADTSSDEYEYETQRLMHIAATDLIRATNQAAHTAAPDATAGRAEAGE